MTNPDRFSVNLQPSNKAYVEALAAKNEFAGGKSEAMNAMTRLLRQLGEMGVRNQLAVPMPDGSYATYILPLTLVDPNTIDDRPAETTSPEDNLE